MRHIVSLILVAVLLAVPGFARAADVHLDAQDRTGPVSLSKLADGSWRVAFPGGSLTVDAATAGAWGEQLNPAPPPAPAPACSNWADDDGDGFKDFQDAGCTGASDTDEANAIPAPAGTEGLVRPTRPLQSDMDSTVTAAVNGDSTAKAFLERFDRFRVYMNGCCWPADRAYAQGWLNPGWEYSDAMVATYTGSALTADEHYLWDKPPSDPTRKRLYINFQCNGTSCTQYAADLGNPNTRQRFLDGAVPTARTAGGMFMDDMNFYLPRVVSNASGTFVRPYNPRTGTQMTDDEWAGYVLQLAKDAKAALPGGEVVINTVAWHGPGILNIPAAKEALGVVDGWELEGNTIGQNPIDYKTQIDYAHSVGAFVIHDLNGAVNRTYSEAAYLCMNAGSDYYFHTDMRPANSWDPLWDKDLGAATSDCVKGADGVYRRSFTNGSVTVNPSNKTGSIN